MKITDTNVLKMIKKMRSEELYTAIKDYPENERDGRSDIQVLADEAGYILSNYRDNACAHYETLKESRRILRETKYGKVIPLWSHSLKPVYDRSDITIAKEVVNEYKRYERLIKKLNSQGIYSQWI